MRCFVAYGDRALIDQSELSGCCDQYHWSLFYFPERFWLSILVWVDVGDQVHQNRSKWEFKPFTIVPANMPHCSFHSHIHHFLTNTVPVQTPAMAEFCVSSYTNNAVLGSTHHFEIKTG